MSKKVRNVIFHLFALVLCLGLVFGNVICAIAMDKVEVAEGNTADMAPNSEKLVSEAAPEFGLNDVTLNKTDVLDNLTGPERLFYNGEFNGKFVVNTEPYLDIYEEASEESEIAGKIYPASYGSIEAWGPQWTKISSGNVTGYISTKEIYIGYDAELKAKEVGHYRATVTAESINIRREADSQSEIVATAVQNESFPIVEEGKDWICINYGYGEGFVSAEVVDQSLQLDEALSIVEEESGVVVTSVAEEQHEVQAASEVQSTPVRTSSPALSVSADDAYLLACMVYVESGAESYEGQLAVANVILNRVRSPRFGGTTIAEIIYADGQFPGAHNGALGMVLERGPSLSCVQAAQEALAGVNNIGDFCYFNGYVDVSTVTRYTVIGGHTFYSYY